MRADGRQGWMNRPEENGLSHLHITDMSRMLGAVSLCACFMPFAQETSAKEQVKVSGIVRSAIIRPTVAIQDRGRGQKRSEVR